MPEGQMTVIHWNGQAKKVMNMTTVKLTGLVFAAAITLQATVGASPLAAKEADTIIHDGLSQSFSAANLKVVGECFDQADEANSLFRANAIKNGLNYIDREQKKTLNAAQDADVNPESRFRTLKHFGALLRAISEFYSHSNYIELQATKLTAKFGSRGFDPFTMELADFHRLTTNADADTKLESLKEANPAVGSSNHEKVARELAVRETSRQWDVLETLIRGRYQGRATTIITALREADCPAKDPDSLD
jgi:hypothetical protein